MDNNEQRVILTAKDILAAADLSCEWVEVPEWSQNKDHPAGVYVRSMTGTERGQYENSIVTQAGRKTKVSLQDAYARLVAICTVDGPDPMTAKPLFTLAQTKILSGKGAAALARVAKVAMRLSGLTEEEVEELTENLE